MALHPCFLNIFTVAREVASRKSSFPVANQNSLRPFYSFASSSTCLCCSSKLGPWGAPPGPPPVIPKTLGMDADITPGVNQVDWKTIEWFRASCDYLPDAMHG